MGYVADLPQFSAEINRSKLCSRGIDTCIEWQEAWDMIGDITLLNLENRRWDIASGDSERC